MWICAEFRFSFHYFGLGFFPRGVLLLHIVTFCIFRFLDSFRSSSHLFAYLFDHRCVFGDVISPGFNLAALRGYLSSLRVAIRATRSHFMFLCVSIQFDTLKCSHFSAASLVLSVDVLNPIFFFFIVVMV